MQANLKCRTALAYIVACAVSCSLLAPPDSEFTRDDDFGGAGGSHDAGPPSDAALEAYADRPLESGSACRAVTCPVNTVCRERSGVGTCMCSSGFVGLAGSCRRAISCDELHTADPELPSGAYALLPLGSVDEISTYCEMTAEGGGWTLVMNQGPTFDPQTDGAQAVIVQTDDGGRGIGTQADAGGEPDGGQKDAGRADGAPADGGADTCLDRDCVSGAYSTVLVRSDVMLDVSDGPIRGEFYLARVVITGIGVSGRGKTLRELFTTGPYFMDSDDNSNVAVRIHSGSSCTEALPYELGNVLCDQCQGDGGCGRTVLVFGDSDSACAGMEKIQFAIGAAYTHTAPWGQCAGWPQAPNYSGYNYLPDNFRIWLR